MSAIHTGEQKAQGFCCHDSVPVQEDNTIAPLSLLFLAKNQIGPVS